MPEVARTLRDVIDTLNPHPLIQDAEFEAFYRGEEHIRAVRGQDAARRLQIGLGKSSETQPYKAFLLGRPGVGKSTELTRLFRMVKDGYQPLRFDVQRELDARNFTPFDVVLLMMVRLAEETKNVTGYAPAASLIKRLLEWFSEGTETEFSEIKTAIEASAGIDTKDTWWNKIVSAFVTVKGSLAYNGSRQQKVVQYKLTRIDGLIETANSILRNCNRLLRDYNGKQWLFAGESFDKTGIPSDKQIDLFLVYGATIFGGLEANLIFNLPLALAFGERASELPSLSKLIIFDTPVYRPDKSPHKEGRAFVRTILEARVDPALFETDQMERLIVASGGNLRDLFSILIEAGVNALEEGRERIAEDDVLRVILAWRAQFQSRLGNTQFDPSPVPNERKVERLVELYNSPDTSTALSDDVLRVLLTANAVQQFNGQYWFAVHPLIVEYLKRANLVPVEALGGAT